MREKTPLMREIDELRNTAPVGSVMAVDLGGSYYFYGDDARRVATALGSELVNVGKDQMGVFIKKEESEKDFVKITDAGITIAVCGLLEKINPNRRGGCCKRGITIVYYGS